MIVSAAYQLLQISLKNRQLRMEQILNWKPAEALLPFAVFISLLVWWLQVVNQPQFLVPTLTQP